MTTTEFSNEFDILYNSITSNNAPGLDEYEKSVFLTKAQEDLIREYFNPKVDTTNGGYDGSQKRQYDFSTLIKVDTCEAVSASISTQSETGIAVQNLSYDNFDDRGYRYYLPNDYFLMINEIVISANKVYSVIPITYAEYQIYMSKPYPYPPKNIVWRLNINNSSINKVEKPRVIVELIGKASGSYRVRYIKRPKPIILTSLKNDGLFINGESTEMTSELPVQMHREILERAVTLAKLAYQSNTTQTIANNQQQGRYDNRRNEQ